MNQKFSFKEIDAEGESTLRAIASAERFNRWMFETIRPYCKGEVLEIGSGIGNISGLFLQSGYPIRLTDIRTAYCRHLQSNFGHYPNLLGISELDLVDPGFDEKFGDLIGAYDTVFALNVVEHIKDDHLAISNAKKLLKPGGNLIILVPAYSFMYNSFDRALEHYRRYTKKSLSSLFAGSAFYIKHTQYFNAVGMVGWFLSGTLLRNKVIPEGQMSLYNKLVPLFRWIDKSLLRNVIGLSVIVVGEK